MRWTGHTQREQTASSCMYRSDTAAPYISIHISIHPSIIQLSLHLLSNPPFIHAVNQPSSRPAHTPLIQWLTLYWLDQYILKWLLCKCLGTMAKRYLCSSFPRQCRGLTQVNYPFSFTYITPNRNERELKKILSNKNRVHRTYNKKGSNLCKSTCNDLRVLDTLDKDACGCSRLTDTEAGTVDGQVIAQI